MPWPIVPVGLFSGLNVRLPASRIHRCQRSDVLFGHHQVVPPYLARALLGSRHVAIEPDGVNVEFWRASPSEAWEGPTTLDGDSFAPRGTPKNRLRLVADGEAYRWELKKKPTRKKK